MKRKRYSEEQIISMLKQHEAGRSMADLAREHGVVENTLYRWKSTSSLEAGYMTATYLYAQEI